MLPIDPSAIPKVPVRKGLVIIDFQSDFLDADGPLHVTQPEGFVDRTLALARHFRKSGDVVWACSEFAKTRPVSSENILVSDEPVLLGASLPRRRSAKPEPAASSPAQVDPEAFLTQGGATCVRSPSGSQVPSYIKDTFGSRDVTFIKSHYSAFKSGQLLHLLRGRLITDLYICGSLGNVGVYATAVDAAMYGYGITVIDDCCGYISASRQADAIQAMIEATGCDVIQSSAVLANTEPKQPTAAKVAQPPSRPKAGGLGGSSDLLHEKLAALKLTGPKPSPKPHESNSLVSTHAGQPLEVDPEAQPSPQPKGDSPSSDSSSNHQTKDPENTADPPPEKTSAACALQVPDSLSEPKTLIQPEAAHASTEMRGSQVYRETTSKRVGQQEPPKLMAVEKLPETGSIGSETLCEGDTTVIYNVLPPAIEAGMFDTLRNEVQWQRMSHQGGEVPRLVAVQGTVADDGSMPVYRHPSDEAPPLLPFSPAVELIKAEAEKHLGHPLNHVLIQFYRDGADYISEHSDKTLDIVKGSYITNISLGAERTMVFRTKRLDKDPSRPDPSTPPQYESKRKIERAKLPHNSLCRVGLSTNMRWLHSIKQDKRMDRDKSDAELAFEGGRISLTFRQIGTFLDRHGTLIWGQGATSKTRAAARPVINGQGNEMIAMLRAFGTENHSSNFDWDETYGKGFDVLHMSSSPRLFYSFDAVTNSRIRLALNEYHVTYAKGSMAASSTGGLIGVEDCQAITMPIKFMDNDMAKTTVHGDLAIMLYLDAVYGSQGPDSSSPEKKNQGRIYTRFQQGLNLLEKWRTISTELGDGPRTATKALKKELSIWEAYAAEAAFIAGSGPTLADFAFLPVLHDIVQQLELRLLDGTPALGSYYKTYLQRKGVAEILVKARSVGADQADA